MALILPRFYPILDTAALAGIGSSAFEMAAAFLDVGVRMLQYRHKGDWTQQHFEEAGQIAARCRIANATFVINDRADFARLLGAALHIGQDDLPVKAARVVVGNQCVIGRSTHNRQQVVWADEESVDYLAVGPIFQTGSKLKPDPVVGVEMLRTVRPLSAKPLVAIGGISLANARQVLDAGADSVAVISGCLPGLSGESSGENDRCTPEAFARTARTWLKEIG